VIELSPSRLHAALVVPVEINTRAAPAGRVAEMATPEIALASSEFPPEMVAVLFVRVWVSVVPTTVPTGATFVVFTGLVPAPIRKLPDVRVARPVPP
jgi:hypothetical protein